MTYSNSTNSSFTLRSASADFTLRQKSVFDSLAALENGRKNDSTLSNEQMDVDERINIKSNKKNHRSFTKHFRGKESIFKKPQNPIPRNYIRSTPDFKRNPHKWKRYSLDDISDISEESNTKAALSFLKELKKRKSTEMECEEKLSEVPSKIIFQKHTSLPEPNDSVESGISFRESKVVMPEYVVGQKQRKERKNRKVKDMNRKELKLDHLLQEEEDE